MELRGTIRAGVKQLDRVAGEINVWLLLLAIGLSALDVTVMVALLLPPATQMSERADMTDGPR
jgi:hypothetical protein